MHKIREIREYPPIHVLFSRWKEEKNIVFLDSSLENRLGRYSIIGRLPYQKLVQDGDSFWVNDEKQKMTFENYLRTYLKEHPEIKDIEWILVRQNSYWDLMDMKLATGTLPDIMEAGAGEKLREWSVHLIQRDDLPVLTQMGPYEVEAGKIDGHY